MPGLRDAALLLEAQSCHLLHLLKGIHRASKVSDVEKVLNVLDDMEDAMDEVLLSSVCEARTRAGCSKPPHAQ